MLALYPSNKLEHLSFLLSTLLKQQPAPVFRSQTILVESPGMQHWLNMALAKEQGIAMNLGFPLPVRFMWDTAREILGRDEVPQQSPYRREVLVWRIDKILRHPDFCSAPDSAPACSYWQQIDNTEEASVQRLQLATAVADVFEQYLLYRPQWLFAWEEGDTVNTGSDDELWQRRIWRMLVSEQPNHPARLHRRAINALNEETAGATLPENVIVFAINTMAPQLIQFLDALAGHTDIHLFHLNPSVSFWGDIKSQKEQAKLLREEGIAKWAQAAQDNPLLANLGQQGRDLFNLLTPLSSYEVAAFDVEEPESGPEPQTLLSRLQKDILHGEAPLPSQTSIPLDHSISVVSAHTELREVQVLHDHLLRMMNAQNGALKPADIVVMCPAIEHYAPFIDAVFQRAGSAQDENEDTPRLPCSIADRSPLDADPLVAAFVQLLTLPDSRFEVSKIMDYLRFEPIQRKFGIASSDLEIMSVWLQKAHVHWGRDNEHKSVTLEQPSSDLYTWQWGLKRLLLGMTLEDTAMVTDGLLTVPDVEGQNMVVLGKLIHLLKQLSYFTSQMRQKRTPEAWQVFLEQMKNACFEVPSQDQSSWDALSRASADFVTHCAEAGFDDELTLNQVRDVLIKQFSTPDAANHFLTGQITFCSMLPMRSIPFRVVCILGLNDGEFPRQSTPISIDLMAQQPRKLGDRSRRLEDRYLFLEAVISARDHLYLSYQGRNSKDNTAREPSLVLAEFMDVLNQGYGVIRNCTKQAALHPFSPDNFTGDRPGFDKGWFRLAKALREKAQLQPASFSPTDDDSEWQTLTAQVLARAFDHPLKTFANQRLGVWLEQQQPLLSDTEPFDDNPLLRYQAVSSMCAALLDAQDPLRLRQHLVLSGEYPDTPLTQQRMVEWQSGATSLVNALGIADGQQNKVVVDTSAGAVQAQAWQGGDKLRLLHYGSQSIKRLVEQYLTLLCFNAAGYSLPLDVFFLKWVKGEAQVRKVSFEPLISTIAEERLARFVTLYEKILTVPFPVFTSLGFALLKKYTANHDASYPGGFTQWLLTPEGTAAWDGELSSDYMKDSLQSDVYITWFYPQGLQVDDFPADAIAEILMPLLGCEKEEKVS